MKEYIQAKKEDLEIVFSIVQASIKSVYPKYYPKEVVEFFMELHSKENILKDIENDLVGILCVDAVYFGTGCYQENHITRVYVTPESTLMYYKEFNEILSKMKEKYGIEAVVLGCTEIPLLLNDENCVLPCLDSVVIHRGYLIYTCGFTLDGNYFVFADDGMFDFVEWVLFDDVTENAY